MPEPSSLFHIEVYVTEFNTVGQELGSWTVEAYDMPSLEETAKALVNTGNLLASGDLPQDSFDTWDDDRDDYYDDETAELGADTIDPYE